MIGSDPEIETVDCERGGVHVARLRTIKANTGRQVCEPELSIDLIAMRHGTSSRYVSKFFHKEQTTFSCLSYPRERSRNCSAAHGTTPPLSLQSRTPVASGAVLILIAHAGAVTELRHRIFVTATNSISAQSLREVPCPQRHAKEINLTR